MNRKELIKEIQDETGYSQKQVDAILRAFTDTIIKQVTEYKDVCLVGFGTFSVSNRSERRQINPKTKEYITIPARTVPVFKFANGVKKQVTRGK